MGYWDGAPYPGQASFLVELPTVLLHERGGNFSQTELQDIVKRHTALGVYPVIRTYTAGTTEEALTPVNPLPLEWKSMPY